MPNREPLNEKLDHHITVSFTKTQYQRIIAFGRAHQDGSKGAAVRRLVERALRESDPND